MKKIQRVSLLFRVLFQCLFFIIPCVFALFWVIWPAQLGIEEWGFFIDFIPKSIRPLLINPIPIATLFTSASISLIPIIVYEIIIFMLIRLFKHYEKGDIFSFDCVNYIKKIGVMLLIACILAPIHEALLSIALTWHNPAGQRVALITFSSTDIIRILTALLIILIAWIMSEACQLKNEQQLTI